MEETREEYNGHCDVKSIIVDVEEAPLDVIDQLNAELQTAYAEIDRLQAEMGKKDDGIVERNELLQLLFHKDKTIERMSSDIQLLEKQLKETASTKFDALARLDTIERKEQTNSSKKTQTEITNERPKPAKKTAKTNGGISVKSKSHEKECNPTPKKRSRKGKLIVSPAPDGYSITSVDLPSTSLQCDEDVTLTNENDEGSSLGDRRDNADDSSSIQLELLSQVRTRRQNQFVLDAFNESGGSNGNAAEDLIVRNDEKAAASSGKSQSDGRPESRLGCVIKLNKIKFEK